MVGKGPDPPSVERMRAAKDRRHTSVWSLLLQPKVLNTAFRILYWIIRLTRAFDG
jgi:hypothetical protein